MEGVLRTWLCQNAKCGAAFDSWDKYPPCTQCGCVRVTWMPAGGHIGNSAKAFDTTLRELADAFKMTDIASAKEGERAMPKLKPQTMHDQGNAMQFAPGFVGAPYQLDAAGRAHAVCQPSAANVNFKVTVPQGQRLAKGRIGGPEQNARIEARHRG